MTSSVKLQLLIVEGSIATDQVALSKA